MTAFGVNTEPFPLQRLIAVAGGLVSGVNVAVATLPASNYIRYIKRIVLLCGLQPADMGTPANFDSVTQDAVFRMLLADVYSGSLLDMTAFGNLNSNEYYSAIPIPVGTAVKLVWYDVLPASAVKCTANLTLNESP